MPIGAPAAVKAAAMTYSGIAPTWTGSGFEKTIRAYRSEIGGTTVVSIEGSKTWQNWATNFFALRTALGDHAEAGRVHAGFARAARSIAPAIDQDLPDDFELGGHSLGAAVAVHLPFYLSKRPRAIYLFAPPRVYADAIPACILDCVRAGGAWRFGNDPVTEEPPFWPQVPLTPIGRSTPLPTESHRIENYLAALAGS